MISMVLNIPNFDLRSDQMGNFSRDEKNPITTRNLNKWNPKNIRCQSALTFLIIGKRKTGKTTLAKEIGESLVQDQTKVMVFTQDSKINYSLNSNTEIYDVYDSQKIKSHINEKRVGAYEIFGESVAVDLVETIVPDINSVIILDDLYYAKNDDNFQCILLNGRNLSTHLIMTQQCIDSTPMIRANIDYVFIFMENIENNRRKLYNHWGLRIFSDYMHFTSILDEATKDFGCLVIDQTSDSNVLTDRVFWYSCPSN